jgi:chemotaxis protein CheX
MTEQELRCFIDVVVNYFSEVTGEPCEMGIPYIKENEPVIADYTGLIGISGSRKGAVYVTSPRSMLSEIAGIILGEEDPAEELIVDMAGEIANTIAGNVRETFGSSFMISVPIVIKGAPKDVIIRLAPPVFVIPVKWRHHSSFLAVGLE